MGGKEVTRVASVDWLTIYNLRFWGLSMQAERPPMVSSDIITSPHAIQFPVLNILFLPFCCYHTIGSKETTRSVIVLMVIGSSNEEDRISLM